MSIESLIYYVLGVAVGFIVALKVLGDAVKSAAKKAADEVWRATYQHAQMDGQTVLWLSWWKMENGKRDPKELFDE